MGGTALASQPEWRIHMAAITTPATTAQTPIASVLCSSTVGADRDMFFEPIHLLYRAQPVTTAPSKTPKLKMPPTAIVSSTIPAQRSRGHWHGSSCGAS
jgi:hypothetical protein